jgi:putative FmdB family regulatory protein
MPIYEYKCPACGHAFERMVKMSDPLPACPECGASEVKKLISQTSFVLKGGGWYSDHYGLKSSSAGASESSSSGGSSSSTTPAAPAAPAPVEAPKPSTSSS